MLQQIFFVVRVSYMLIFAVQHCWKRGTTFSVVIFVSLAFIKFNFWMWATCGVVSRDRLSSAQPSVRPSLLFRVAQG